ncbi:hypothetical protein F0562_002281 [Nyssa sinensis]|uniref:TF-B3 domain-containing protein n=1 Tax=Nyssa sinensis TaxID=561372 RepID=A0A5J5C986_9ASTE|nr:hypothetical protein F0562_002281 [Nyssa sinensis]
MNTSPEHEEKQNSSQTALASRQEYSDRIVEFDKEGNMTITFVRTTQDHDQTSNDVISESEPRLQEESHFEKKLSYSDVSLGELTIPRKYWKHFPALETAITEGPSKWEQINCLDDADNKNLPMNFGWHAKWCVIKKGWPDFVQKHNLKANDVVRFDKRNLQTEEGNFKFLLKFIRAIGILMLQT